MSAFCSWVCADTLAWFIADPSACTNSAVAPLLAFRTTTVSGASATAVASAGIAAFANLSGMSKPLAHVFARLTDRYHGSIHLRLQDCASLHSCPGELLAA